jgi:hypothetical protein
MLQDEDTGVAAEAHKGAGQAHSKSRTVEWFLSAEAVELILLKQRSHRTASLACEALTLLVVYSGASTAASAAVLQRCASDFHQLACQGCLCRVGHTG